MAGDLPMRLEKLFLLKLEQSLTVVSPTRKPGTVPVLGKWWCLLISCPSVPSIQDNQSGHASWLPFVVMAAIPEIRSDELLDKEGRSDRT